MFTASCGAEGKKLQRKRDQLGEDDDDAGNLNGGNSSESDSEMGAVVERADELDALNAMQKELAPVSAGAAEGLDDVAGVPADDADQDVPARVGEAEVLAAPAGSAGCSSTGSLPALAICMSESRIAHRPPQGAHREIFCVDSGAALGRFHIMWGGKTVQIQCRQHRSCKLMLNVTWFADAEVEAYRWAALGKVASAAEHVSEADRLTELGKARAAQVRAKRRAQCDGPARS